MQEINNFKMLVRGQHESKIAEAITYLTDEVKKELFKEFGTNDIATIAIRLSMGF